MLMKFALFPLPVVRVGFVSVFSLVNAHSEMSFS
jgi:hypothetical protein